MYGSTAGSESGSKSCIESLPASVYECDSDFESGGGVELWVGVCVLVHVGVSARV